MKDMTTISDNCVRIQNEAITAGTTLFYLSTPFSRYTPFSTPKKPGQRSSFFPIYTIYLFDCHSWNLLKCTLWLRTSTLVQLTAETRFKILFASCICNSFCPTSTGWGTERYAMGFLLRICCGDEMGHYWFHMNAIWVGISHQSVIFIHPDDLWKFLHLVSPAYLTYSILESAQINLLVIFSNDEEIARHSSSKDFWVSICFGLHVTMRWYSSLIPSCAAYNLSD